MKVQQTLYTTLAALAAATGDPDVPVWCVESKSGYVYVPNGGSYNPNGTTVVQSRDGNARWMSYSGALADESLTPDQDDALDAASALDATHPPIVSGDTAADISITGNAATASALAASVNIGSTPFDGSADIEIPRLRPEADSADAIRLQRADHSTLVNIDTLNDKIGVGTEAPTNTLSFRLGTNVVVGIEPHPSTDHVGDDLTIVAGPVTQMQIKTVHVEAGGAGYTVGDVLTLEAPSVLGGAQATFTASEVTDGVVIAVTPLTAGADYHVGVKTTTVAPVGGAGCTIHVTEVESATNKDGGDLRIGSGVSTGTGSSKVIIENSPAGVAGATENPPVTQVTIDGNTVEVTNRLKVGTHFGLGLTPIAARTHIADAAGGTEVATINAILDVLEAFGLVLPAE